MPERRSGRGAADCKSVVFGLSRFESYLRHKESPGSIPGGSITGNAPVNWRYGFESLRWCKSGSTSLYGVLADEVIALV